MSLWVSILQHEKSEKEDVVKYSFQTKPGVDPCYVVYRLAQFALHVVIAIMSFFEVFTKLGSQPGLWYYPKWFLYLSSWSMFANVLQSLMGAVILSISYKQRDVSSTPTTVHGVPEKALETYQIMYRVALNLAVLTSAIIWVLKKLPPGMVSDNLDYSQVAMMVELNAGSLLMLVDLFVINFAYTMITGVYSLLVLMVYFLVTFVHHAVGAKDRYDRHPFIYPKLNWEKLGETFEMVLFSLLLLEIINAGILWWMCQLRRRLAALERGHRQNDLRASTPDPDSIYNQTLDSTAFSHSGEPPPGTTKKRGSKKQDKKTKNPPTDKKLEELEAQIRAMDEDLTRMKEQLQNSPQDVILTHEIKQMTDAINKKFKEYDDHRQLINNSKTDKKE